jgi:predicted RNase H-like HicB family nuclease
MRYIVFIRRTGTGYSADVPDLPGCIAVGMTVEHTRQQIAEAVEGHLEVMRDSGESIPVPSSGLEFTIDEDMGEEFCTWIEPDLEEPMSTLSRPAVAAKPKSKRKQR